MGPAKSDDEQHDEDDKKPKKLTREQKKQEKEAAKQAKIEAKEAAKSAKSVAKQGRFGRGRGRGSGRGKQATLSPAMPESQATVAAKAEKAGFTSQLMKLAARQDAIDSGKSQNQMLRALEENGGLLHAAKRALLGA